MSVRKTSILISLTSFALFAIVSNTKLNNPKPLWNSTAVDKLRQALLTTYDKFSRPIQHYNKTTVEIDLTIRHLDLNEFKNTLTVYCWVKLSWMDDKLKWNTSDFEGITMLHMADHEIWQPDVFLYNSGAGSSIDYYGNTLCLLYDNGNVLWVPPSQFVVFCALDLRLWPFDTQECYLRLGSWTHNANEIDLQLRKGNDMVEQLVENTEWDLLNVSRERNEKYYPCCEEPYVSVTYNITIRRRSPTYKAIIITPTFAIVAMTLLSFWLPPQAGEKILLNCCTAIIISIFMLYFTQKCPAMGDHTPLIVLFYSSSLYVISFSLIGSVSVIWLSRTQHHKSLPWIIKHPLTNWLGRWLGLGAYIHQTCVSRSRVTAKEMRDQQPVFDDQHSGDEHHIISPPETPALSQSDWILLAVAIDRISFIFYTLLFAILAITYSV